MHNDITGIILSGGKSRRMKHDKSSLKIGDSTLLSRVVRLMQTLFSRVIIVSDNSEKHREIGIPIFVDIYKNRGPLGGLHSGLVHSCTHWNFVISNDLPLMTKEMIEYIGNYKTDKLITVPQIHGKIQPLTGKYSQNIIDFIEKTLDSTEKDLGNSIKQKGASLHSIIHHFDSEIIEIENLPFFSEDIFLNLNYGEDYNKALSIIDKN